MKKKNNNLSDRMKEYERSFELRMMRRIPMIIRLDGKSFHSWTKKTGCVRPFDNKLIDMMSLLTKYLCENISGATLGYTQSDEISLLILDNQSIDTEPWFRKRIQKVISISASYATYWFNANNKFENKVPAFFDARAFLLPNDEVRNYFIWRQEDATANSLSMLAQSLYPHNMLQCRNSADLHHLCWEKGFNWNNLSIQEKRGTCVYKKTFDVLNQNGATTRKRFVVDTQIPILSSDIGNEWWSKIVGL